MAKSDFEFFKVRSVCAAWALLAICASAPASAGSEPLRLDPGMTGFADLGVIQCDDFIELLPIGPKGFRQSLMTYAQGFIYAKSGQSMDQVLADRDGAWTYETLSDEMVKYCAANPDKSVPDAAAHLWEALSS